MFFSAMLHHLITECYMMYVRPVQGHIYKSKAVRKIQEE